MASDPNCNPVAISAPCCRLLRLRRTRVLRADALPVLRRHPHGSTAALSAVVAMPPHGPRRKMGVPAILPNTCPLDTLCA